MDLFDLLFLAVALTTVLTLIGAGVAAAAGRGGSARRALRRLGIGLGAYALIVLVTSAVVPRRTVSVGELMCFDDWCIRVDSASRAATRYTIDLSIVSEAKRVTQRERGLVVYLEDANGHRIAPEPDPSAKGFDVAIGPGESFQTRRSFATSDSAVGLAVVHTGFPIAWFIIGVGPFRPEPIVRFEPPVRNAR